MFKKIISFLLAMVMVVGVLAGCETATNNTPTEAEVPAYKVTFAMKGHILSEQKVAEGESPEMVDTKVQGLVFSSWSDANGEHVDPYTVKITEDTRFEAIAYPDISSHAAFLQVDEDGFLRPDDALTADDLYFALHNLAVDGAEAYFPGLYTGKAKVSGQELKQVLEHFFPSQTVAEAFGDEITRASFAQGMLKLLNRSWEEPQSMEEVQLPKDVHAGREDSAVLLESCLEHTPDAAGSSWADMELPAPYEPGFVNIEGWLYYVQEDGYFLKDGNVGVLYFGEDGRYTSGDAELDRMVAERIAKFYEENPDKTRFEILRVAYDHCVGNYEYLRRNIYGKGHTGWEIDDAKVMFETGLGNCYNFAAIFWALARGLGYEAYGIAGNCTGSVQPHGWVQISFEGEPYFFDPEWHYDYIHDGRPVKDMFMIAMEDAWYWTYDYYPI